MRNERPACEGASGLKDEDKARGIYVAIEGIDGSGKTAVARALNNTLALKGYTTAIVREPYSEEIRRILSLFPDLDPLVEAYLFAADRMLLHYTVLKPLLEKREIVISDRSYVASLVYQTVRGAPREAVEALNAHCIKPDVVFLLDLPVEVAVERLEKKRGRQLRHLERRELLPMLREGYLRLAREWADKIKIVDATRPVSEIVEAVVSEIEVMVRRAESPSVE